MEVAPQGRLLSLTSCLTWPGPFPHREPPLRPLPGLRADALSRRPPNPDDPRNFRPRPQETPQTVPRRQPHLAEVALGLAPQPGDHSAFGGNLESTQPRATWAQTEVGDFGRWLTFVPSSSPSTVVRGSLCPSPTLLAKPPSSPPRALPLPEGAPGCSREGVPQPLALGAQGCLRKRRTTGKL